MITLANIFAFCYIYEIVQRKFVFYSSINNTNAIKNQLNYYFMEPWYLFESVNPFTSQQNLFYHSKN